MTINVEDAIAKAAAAVLRTDLGPPPLVVYDEGDLPPTAIPPYVRMYAVITWPGGHDANALDGASRTLGVRFIAHCVGANDTAARAVGYRVARAWRDLRLIVPTLGFGLLRQVSAPDPIRDQSTGVVVQAQIQEYETIATIN